MIIRGKNTIRRKLQILKKQKVANSYLRTSGFK